MQVLWEFSEYGYVIRYKLWVWVCIPRFAEYSYAIWHIQFGGYAYSGCIVHVCYQTHAVSMGMHTSVCRVHVCYQTHTVGISMHTRVAEPTYATRHILRVWVCRRRFAVLVCYQTHSAGISMHTSVCTTLVCYQTHTMGMRVHTSIWSPRMLSDTYSGYGYAYLSSFQSLRMLSDTNCGYECYLGLQSPHM